MEPNRKLVYIVEDDEQQLYVLRILLSDAGYDVVTEVEADRVLGRIQELKPDVILLDVMLPSNCGLDGFQLCSQIRTLPDFQDTVILMVSAIAEGANSSRAKMTAQVGANDFLVKPYNPPDLIKRIAELCP